MLVTTTGQTVLVRVLPSLGVGGVIGEWLSSTSLPLQGKYTWHILEGHDASHTSIAVAGLPATMVGTREAVNLMSS
jgi:hypothetical protein